jgi:hypothetical protein
MPHADSQFGAAWPRSVITRSGEQAGLGRDSLPVSCTTKRHHQRVGADGRRYLPATRPSAVSQRSVPALPSGQDPTRVQFIRSS